MYEHKIISEFKDRAFFTKKELFNFLDKKKSGLSDSYYRLLLSNLRKRAVIEDLKKNVYTIKNKPLFLPTIDKRIKKLINTIQKNTNDIQYICWNSLWLNSFTIHQSNSSMIIFECEKEFSERVYHILKDSKYENVYLKPKKEVIDIYLSENKNSIIIKPLISRSPSVELSGIRIPKLEKILVDVYADQNLFYAYKGKELANIFTNSILDFKFNLSTFLNYAKRRNRYDELVEYIRNLSLINEEILMGENKK